MTASEALITVLIDLLDKLKDCPTTGISYTSAEVMMDDIMEVLEMPEILPDAIDLGYSMSIDEDTLALVQGVLKAATTIPVDDTIWCEECGHSENVHALDAKNVMRCWQWLEGQDIECECPCTPTNGDLQPPTQPKTDLLSLINS